MKRWRSHLLTSLVILSSLIFVVASVQPYHLDSSDEVWDYRGDPIMYDDDLVLDRFTIADLEMKSVIYYAINHNAKTKNTYLSFFIAVLPDPMYPINGTQIEFYGALTSFQLRINDESIFLNSTSSTMFISNGYNPGEMSQTSYNIIRHDFNHDFAESYIFGTSIDVEISYQYAILSNHSRYSEGGEEVILGNSPQSSFRHSLPVLGYGFSNFMRIVSILILIGVALFLLYAEYPMFSHHDPIGPERLKFLTSIYPQVFVFALVCYLGPKYASFIHYLLLLVMYAALPAFIELISKNYHYKGVYTQFTITPPTNSSDRSFLPNTIKLDNITYNNKKIHNKDLLKHYDAALFTTLILRVLVTSLLVLVVAYTLKYELVFGLMYNIWVIMRKVSI